jgi:secondary thiamine-phosphate synthase enzyme
VIERFSIETASKEELVDITDEVKRIVEKSRVTQGVCIVYIPHATAAITINENADPSISKDILAAVDKMVSRDVDYAHDRIDNNARAHIKSSLIGPSEAIPIINGKLALGTWQDVFLCEFDGPREVRNVIVVVIQDSENIRK